MDNDYSRVFSKIESLLTYASLDIINIYTPSASKGSKMNSLFALRSQILEIAKSKLTNLPESSVPIPSNLLTKDEPTKPLSNNPTLERIQTNNSIPS